MTTRPRPTRRKTTAAAAPPPDQPAGDQDARPPCPTCGSAEPERLTSHQAAGFEWIRYRCRALGCGRVWIARRPAKS